MMFIRKYKEYVHEFETKLNRKLTVEERKFIIWLVKKRVRH